MIIKVVRSEVVYGHTTVKHKWQINSVKDLN